MIGFASLIVWLGRERNVGPSQAPASGSLRSSSQETLISVERG
jgi:hypothetical protein